MNGSKLAEFWFKRAEKLGLDAPTQSMMEDALNTAQDEVYNDIIYALSENGMSDAAREVEDWQKRRRLNAQES